MEPTVSLSSEAKEYLLKVALQAIKDGFKGEFRPPKIENVPRQCQQKGACFVTLQTNNQLRGCIGHTEVTQPLYLDVYENAQAAAFSDPRFWPLKPNELENLDLEISLLSKAEKLRGTLQEKIDQIKPKVHGVILDCQGRKATFLPQVWEDLPDKKDFLAQLCQKALLPGEAWKDPTTDFLAYTVEKINL
ncbi:hypothetical protein A2160_03115 [Candidatus Beckwithbacteria bacterium RBG_13_42_9]|uniref:AMMECR1 domain-containing protein n=1 Tax=Candidatus Beckwithbacteria bacterium RBG_13_42_9 TaxID=1797457 RepID=A0A1F5E7Q8_9BACT|nr:MAG: hypothetical protein A2160_03115 [Candidatus Beckwithbacteria bacterium RBG_13_42_9]